jgi:glycosyltransferase involved in cell wall biosynthesis
MTIVHVVKTLDPAAGGLPVVPVRLAAAQAALGHEVRVLAEHDRAAEPKVPALCQGVPGAELIGFGWLTPAGPSALLGRGPVYAELAGPDNAADVYHLHGLWEPVLWAAAATARRTGRPYLVAPHGMLDPWSLAQKRWKKRLGLALGWRGLLNGAAALHLLNADEEHLIAPLRLTAPAHVIPNGVFLEEADQGVPGAFRAAHPELHDQPFILFLSRLHYKKGLDYLADAFRLLAARRPDVRLVVAGPDGGARAEFEHRVSGHGLMERVHLVGPLAGRAKWDALADAAGFCLPSRQEGFSMAILEALACRVPVVASAACHFPEVAEVGAGAVVPLDAESIAAALGRVLDDPQAARRMGAAGRRLVEERFTWQRAAERSIAAYEHVLARR